MVCAGLLFTVSAYADVSQAETDFSLANKPPASVTAAEIYALPLDQRDAWLHGGLTQVIAVYASFNQTKSGCLKNWMVNGDAMASILSYMQAYPDRPAYSVVYAVANTACPDEN